MTGSSGTYNFSPSNGEIVLAAYERLQIRTPSIRQEHMLSARRECNFLFAQWSNSVGPDLWEVIRTQTTLTQGTATYTLPTKTITVLDSSIVLNFGTSSESRRFITPISRTEYMTYANQQTQGQPTVWWFDRLISPTVTFWPVPDGNGPYTWDFYSVTQQQDVNLPGGETPDIPYRWLDAMVAGLSHRLSRIYAPQLEQMRKADAMEAYDIAAKQDTEVAPFKISPLLSNYFRI
jgi:hypothetical protein